MKIDITTKSGNVHRVKCIAHRGGLAITKRLIDGGFGKGWVITHVRSSNCFGGDIGVLTKQEAKIALDALLSNGVDWTATEPDLLSKDRLLAAKKATNAAIKVLRLYRASRR